MTGSWSASDAFTSSRPQRPPSAGAYPSGARRIAGAVGPDDDRRGVPRRTPALSADLLEGNQRLEWEIVFRLRLFNTNHATQAWLRRSSMPFAPFALAFLFVQPDLDPDRDWPEVVTATRIWPAGHDFAKPGPLLARFTEFTEDQNRKFTPAGSDDVWDFRATLPDRCEPHMRRDAVYVGLGFSTLDTAQDTFATVCDAANSELDIPGAFCFVSNPSGEPADHRVLTAERHAASDHNTIRIHSHQALTTPQLRSPLPYSSVPVLATLYEQSWHGPVLNRMWYLDQALREADVNRRAADLARHCRRRRPQ